MKAERYGHVYELFAMARKRDEKERARFLGEQCEGDEELRGEVEKLLAADADPLPLDAPAVPELLARIDPQELAVAGALAVRNEDRVTLEQASERLLERLGAARSARRHEEGEELARGGMGTVASVWDPILRRHLAKKTLRNAAEAGGGSSTTDPRSLGRFMEEAQITAQLEHPGIVPVHELGLDAEGRVFFTMSLVRGQSLKTVFEHVRAGREGWTLARALHSVLRVCEAVAYAHSRGVVHRDLKPGNVMVGRFGETYVMDWGLARLLGNEETKDIRLRPEPGSPDGLDSVRRDFVAEEPESPLVTMDGDVVGTPAYMPPEQARGEIHKVGPQADVYAVGAMLYQLLTGQAPFTGGSDGTSPRATLRRVLEGAPPPVVELAPGTPPELVAICEKAMAREIEDRYADVQGLADDLRAFLEVRVVRAYETGAFAELRKWVRRNRAVAASLAAAVLALAAGLVFSLDQKQRADENATAAATQATLATAEARQKEAYFERLLEVVDRMLTRVGDDTLADVPRMDAVRRQLLEDALAFHRELLEDRREDPRVGRGTAMSYRKVGHIRSELGDHAGAERAHRKAIAVWESLVASDPDDRIAQQQLAWEHNVLGLCLQEQGRLETAEQQFRRARTEMDRLVAEDPDHPGLRFSLAGVHANLGRLSVQTGETPAALGHMRVAMDLRERLVEEHGDNLQYRMELGKQKMSLGLVLTRVGKYGEAERILVEGKRIFEELLEQTPDDRDYRRLIGGVGVNLGSLHMHTRSWVAAAEALREAVEVLDDLTADHPDVPAYRSELGAALSNYAYVLAQSGEPERTLELAERAIAEQELALTFAPRNAQYQKHLLAHHMVVCDLHLQGGRHGEAARIAEEIARLGFQGPEPAFRACLCLCRSIPVIRGDGELSRVEHTALVEERGRRAVELLRVAVDRGFRQVAVLDADLFDCLRGRNDFQQLRQELDGLTREK